MNDKEFLINESKVFCMAPWVHMHTTPVGVASPCCIARSQVGSSISQSLDTLINTQEMKTLRLDMLNERFNPACSTCHSHEAGGIRSSRDQYAGRFTQHFDEVIANTQPDGHLDNFKMRYFDIRFNNICNFKCRTCNADYSSQWEQEDLKRGLPFARVYPKNNRPALIEEIITHIPHMEYAYFAGGEPLITEEHYILLEEMIKQGRTDIALVYNSNASNLKFKSRDIIELWSHFKQPIEMWASVDHVGERAEYIRHGTDWGQVESNLIKLKSIENVRLALNTVISVFNYPTLHEFYGYLIDTGIYLPQPSPTFSAYSMMSPEHLTARVLPVDIKTIAKQNINNLLVGMIKKGFVANQINSIQSNITWTQAENTWDTYKVHFQNEIAALDKVRGEDFCKVFPELASLMD